MANDLVRLRVMADAYPRAYFFRLCEHLASDKEVSYEEWEGLFERLMGIEGKALNEEIPDRSERNIEFFTRFKRGHPDQLVLLHFNGASGDPRFAGNDFFAGHWLYFEGAKILSDVQAESGETDMRVADATIFRTRMGNRGDETDEIGLCSPDADGRPNWQESEQVKLVSVDEQQGLIRVQRGYVGTRPRAFRAGETYAAAHVTRGPCGPTANLMWNYNFSTRCPVDAKGRSCADALLERLSQLFSDTGALAAFDGLEFDAIFHDLALEADYDASGKGGNGIFDGVNTYGLGLFQFCRRLRAAIGEQKLILGDFNNPTFQRSFGIFNGIESEGWPNSEDTQLLYWSEGLNRHWFWAQNGRAPVFNYFNHRFMHNDATGKRAASRVPYNIHRLVFAAAMFTDSAVCFFDGSPGEPDEKLGIWDELKMGVENRLGWLGRPMAPARRLALEQPDLLQGRGNPASKELAGRFLGSRASVNFDESGVRMEGAEPSDSRLRFTLRGVPCDGPDLFISMKARAQAMRGYPKEIARCVQVGLAPLEGQLVTPAAPALSGKQSESMEEGRAIEDSYAAVQYVDRMQINGELRPAYTARLRAGERAGWACWERDVRVPEGGRLEFFTGIRPPKGSVSNGVAFRLFISERGRCGANVPVQSVFEHFQTESRWIHHCIPLAAWSGNHVRLKFASNLAPNGDQSYWGDVWILGPASPAPSRAHSVRFITWAGETDFTSSFYFSDVCVPQVGITFKVEGSEPIWISSVTVHGHPDAIIREFERGVVVANPSCHEYTFDLEQLIPDQTFRRLKASSMQDTKANDGSTVRGRLTLGERDALFLVKKSAVFLSEAGDTRPNH